MKLLGGETSAQQRADIREKPLAGSRDFEPGSALENLKNSLKDSEVSDTNLGLMLGRYGAQTPEIIKEYVTKGGASLCSGTCLGAEINYTVDREQAITLEDIVYRRLNLGFEPYGLEFFEKEIKNFVLSAS